MLPDDHRDARVRLFCFPFAGGGVGAFGKLRQCLSSEVAVVAIELAGRGRLIRSAPVEDLVEMARAASDAIGPHTDGPYALLGSSMGAVLAFEVARELRRRGARGPDRLVVASAAAPQLAGREPPIHLLSDADLLHKLREYQGAPEEVLDNEEMMRLLLPAVRADLKAHRDYVYLPEPPLGCPIAALGGTEDRLVDVDELRAWERQTAASFQLDLLPEGHFLLDASAPAVARFVERHVVEGG
ncbi:MAG TPA: alpha/beta fold hydrolase [Thermoleophilaceae bacterium]|nr:alpha/beta fold hydrolase [Thermoleophilaceae bacterium]